MLAYTDKPEVLSQRPVANQHRLRLLFSPT